jgi:UDP-GlcNAc:undecaprenyl-phosphate/decaprenyl-phosphate GlcNAc-1-phosphate transferase
MFSFCWMLFGIGLITSILVIGTGMILAHYLQLVDHPGEHKQHQVSTPFVGGAGVVGAFLVVMILAQDRQYLVATETWVIATGVLVLFAVGWADDLWKLSCTIRFLIQVLIACLMVYGGDIEVSTLGQIVPWITLELGALAIFFTIFATVGAINALNMIDGVDGLAGSVSLVSLSLIAIAVLVAGQHQESLLLILAASAGVVGFLGFNLRFFGRRRALVFLGDNGSMVLGFLFAWLFISLSQGPTPAMTPVTALWLFAVPLFDTATAIVRRVRLGNSPFHPDRFHLHHLLLRAGFKVGDAVLAIVLLHGLLGVVGLAGLYLGVWEPLMFAGFLGAFLGYLYLTYRPWRCMQALRRWHDWLGLMKADCQGVFIGYFGLEAAEDVLRILREEMIPESDCDLRVYQLRPDSADTCLYVVLETRLAEENRFESELRQMIGRLKKRFSAHRDIMIRQYVRRDPTNEQRVGQKSIFQDLRQIERRDARDKVLLWYADFSPNRSLSRKAQSAPVPGATDSPPVSSGWVRLQQRRQRL